METNIITALLAIMTIGIGAVSVQLRQLNQNMRNVMDRIIKLETEHEIMMQEHEGHRHNPSSRRPGAKNAE